MSNVAGKWETVVKSPLGDQKSTMTVTDNGDGTFTGSQDGAQGSMAVKNGKVNGDTLTWQMDMTVPMPMTLDCEATVSGDSIQGSVKAGAFGSFPLTGTRAG